MSNEKKMTVAELQEMVERLRLENEALRKRGERELKLKVGEKGGVSLYGLNSRFPVTLYKSQWERLIGFTDNIKAFIKAHPELKDKPIGEAKSSEVVAEKKE